MGYRLIKSTMAFNFEDAELLGNDGLSVTSISWIGSQSMASKLHSSSSLKDGVFMKLTDTSADSKTDDATLQTELMLQDLAALFSEGEAKGESFMELDDIFGIDGPETEMAKAEMLEEPSDTETTYANDSDTEAEMAKTEMLEELADTETAYANDSDTLLPSDRMLEQLVAESVSRAGMFKVPTSTGSVADQLRAIATPKDPFSQMTAKWVQLSKRRRDQPQDPEVYEMNKKKLLQLADELNDAFGEEHFQQGLQNLLEVFWWRQGLPHGTPVAYIVGRQELVRSVHNKILPKYGYTGDLGFYSMLLALEEYCDDDEMLGKMLQTDKLLLLPTSSTLCAVFDAVEKFARIPPVNE